jgi:hypothetical protein
MEFYLQIYCPSEELISDLNENLKRNIISSNYSDSNPFEELLRRNFKKENCVSAIKLYYNFYTILRSNPKSNLHKYYRILLSNNAEYVQLGIFHEYAF